MKKTIRIYNNNIIIKKDIAEKIREYEILKREVEPLIKMLKDNAKEEMLELGKDKIVSNGISLSLKAPYEKTSIDTSALKKDYPKIFEKYKKITSVDTSIVLSVGE